MALLHPVLYAYYHYVGRLLSWLYAKLPFSFKYSLKLATLSSKYKKEAGKLLLVDYR